MFREGKIDIEREREKIEWVEALKMKMRERSWAWTTFYTTAEQQQPVVCKEVAEKKMMMMKRQHKVYSELDDERVRRQPSRISHLQRLLEASTNLTRHLDIFWYLFFSSSEAFPHTFSPLRCMFDFLYQFSCWCCLRVERKNLNDPWSSSHRHSRVSERDKNTISVAR